MARRNKNAWKKWHDPNATDADYARWREEHMKRIRAEAIALLESAIGNSGRAMSTTELARMTGLARGTADRYGRKRNFGKRGPTLLTFVALRNR